MEEFGQKKSGSGLILVLVLIAALAVGAYIFKDKLGGGAPTEEVPPTTTEATTPPTTAEGEGLVTETKKLDIDRPTSADAEVPSAYVSTDPAVQKMMEPRKLGSDSAPVKIIEYASLTCGHCGAFHRETLPAFKTQFIDTGRVQITYKEFPLNEPAVNASMLLRCAPAEQYHSFMKTLFDSQDKWAYDPKYMDLLRAEAKTAGLDDAAIDACLANNELKKSIIGGMKAGSEKFKVQSTPSFVFNNGEYVLVGNQPMTIISETIAKAEKGELKSAPTNLSTSPDPHAGHGGDHGAAMTPAPGAAMAPKPAETTPTTTP